MNVLAIFIGVLSTTLGQSLLLHLLFPGWMAAHGLLVLMGLLLLNNGLAGLILLLHR